MSVVLLRHTLIQSLGCVCVCVCVCVRARTEGVSSMGCQLHRNPPFSNSLCRTKPVQRTLDNRITRSPHEHIRRDKSVPLDPLSLSHTTHSHIAEEVHSLRDFWMCFLLEALTAASTLRPSVLPFPPASPQIEWLKLFLPPFPFASLE